MSGLQKQARPIPSTSKPAARSDVSRSTRSAASTWVGFLELALPRCPRRQIPGPSGAIRVPGNMAWVPTPVTGRARGQGALHGDRPSAAVGQS